MSSDGNKELAAGEDRHATGKSIVCRVSEWTRYPCSALSVVVNAQADARRKASEEQGACIQAGDQHRPPQPHYLPVHLMRVSL